MQTRYQLAGQTLEECVASRQTGWPGCIYKSQKGVTTAICALCFTGETFGTGTLVGAAAGENLGDAINSAVANATCTELGCPN